MKRNCKVKHTPYQPADEDYICPKCSKVLINKGPVIDNDPTDNDIVCGLLHLIDNIVCENCDYQASGRAFVIRLLKARNVVPCPTCSTCPTCLGKRFISKSRI